MDSQVTSPEGRAVDSMWLLLLAFAVLVFAAPALRALAARLAADRTRQRSLAEPPDTVSLVRLAEPRWRNPELLAAAERHLAAAGFVEAGVYIVREMTELTLALHAHPAEHAYAVLYDHPHSGFWAELVTRYEDGTLANYTTLEPVDLDLPAGSMLVAAPELTLAELWKRMLAERPRRDMRECSRAAAARDFERGYAESVEHHRRQTAAREADVSQVA